MVSETIDRHEFTFAHALDQLLAHMHEATAQIESALRNADQWDHMGVRKAATQLKHRVEEAINLREHWDQLFADQACQRWKGRRP